jgi:hypothetical protein
MILTSFQPRLWLLASASLFISFSIPLYFCLFSWYLVSATGIIIFSYHEDFSWCFSPRSTGEPHPQHRHQDCITFPAMWDVPSTAPFESVQVSSSCF